MAINYVGGLVVDEQATAAYSHLFQGLADPTRLALLQHLSIGEHRVRDLVEHMGFAQSTVSKHLSFLLECRLVSVRPEGRASWYSLTNPPLLAVLITAAEALLESNGTRAVLCSHLRDADASGPAASSAARLGEERAS